MNQRQFDLGVWGEEMMVICVETYETREKGQGRGRQIEDIMGEDPRFAEDLGGDLVEHFLVFCCPSCA